MSMWSYLSFTSSNHGNNHGCQYTLIFVHIRCMFKIIEQTVGTMISGLYFSVCLILMNIST